MTTCQKKRKYCVEYCFFTIFTFSLAKLIEFVDFSKFSFIYCEYICKKKT